MTDDPRDRLPLIGTPPWSERYTLDTFPTPLSMLSFLKNWATSLHPERGGLILHGGAGTGKTALMADMLRRAAWSDPSVDWGFRCDAFFQRRLREGVSRWTPPPVWFWSWVTCRDYFRSIRTGKLDAGDGALLTETRARAEVDRVNVLGIDDLDTEQPQPSWIESLVIWLVDRPLNGRRLLLTVNASPANWKALFGERVSDRLLDTEHFYVINVGGVSLRARA